MISTEYFSSYEKRKINGSNDSEYQVHEEEAVNPEKVRYRPELRQEIRNIEHKKNAENTGSQTL